MILATDLGWGQVAYVQNPTTVMVHEYNICKESLMFKVIPFRAFTQGSYLPGAWRLYTTDFSDGYVDTEPSLKSRVKPSVNIMTLFIINRGNRGR